MLFVNLELMLTFLLLNGYGNFDKLGARFIYDSDYCSRQIGALLRYSLLYLAIEPD